MGAIIPTGGEAKGRLTLRFPALSENGNDVRHEQILRHMGSDWRLLASSPSRRVMVNRDSPLLQKRLAECDCARRYRRMCSEAIGPPAHARRERQCLQHQQRQSRYSECIRRALHARVTSNKDSMNIDDLPAHPLLHPAYLPSHQSDAINDFFARLLFTQDDPPECSTCFEKYHGMRMQGTRCSIVL